MCAAQQLHLAFSQLRNRWQYLAPNKQSQGWGVVATAQAHPCSAAVGTLSSRPELSTAPCSHLQVWVKPSAEMQFLYGNHVLKNGLGRITENTPAYTGVVVYSMSGEDRAQRDCLDCDLDCIS